MRGVLAATNASNADPIRRRPLNGSVKPSRMNALQSLWTASQRLNAQDAALSWRYFSDIFASIGVISAAVPRYPEWAAAGDPLTRSQGSRVQQKSGRGCHWPGF